MIGATPGEIAIGEVLDLGKRRLYPSRTAALDAQLLLGHVLDRRREWLLAHGEAGVGPGELRAFLELVERRAAGEPVAYLRGWIEWYGLEFAVAKGVLIPRPETEILLDEAMRLAAETGARMAVDVGTGSGAVAVGLATRLPNLHVIAVEKDSEAAAVASQNIASHELSRRVSLLKGNLLEPLIERPDLVVANLPYLSDEMMAELDRDARHEPAAALHAGPLGLELYVELAEQMVNRGWRVPLAIEIDPRQARSTIEILAGKLGGSRATVTRDLAGHDRVVTFKP